MKWGTLEKMHVKVKCCYSSLKNNNELILWMGCLLHQHIQIHMYTCVNVYMGQTNKLQNDIITYVIIDAYMRILKQNILCSVSVVSLNHYASKCIPNTFSSCRKEMFETFALHESTCGVCAYIQSYTHAHTYTLTPIKLSIFRLTCAHLHTAVHTVCIHNIQYTHEFICFSKLDKTTYRMIMMCCALCEFKIECVHTMKSIQVGIWCDRIVWMDFEKEKNVETVAATAAATTHGKMQRENDAKWSEEKEKVLNESR